MMTIETICLEFSSLHPDDLNRWIENTWIRPEGPPGAYRFHDMDIARIRLILELRDTLEVNEPALPTVLLLLDQLYEMRRHMRRLNEALAAVPEEVRTLLSEYLEVR